MPKVILKRDIYKKLKRPILDHELFYIRKSILEYEPKLKYLFECLDISTNDLFFYWESQSPCYYEEIGEIIEAKNIVNKSSSKTYHLYSDCILLDTYSIEYIIPTAIIKKNDFELINSFTEWFNETLKHVKLEDSYKIQLDYNHNFAKKYNLNLLDAESNDIIKFEKNRYSLIEQHFASGYFNYQINQILNLKDLIDKGNSEYISFIELKYKTLELFFEYVKWTKHSDKALPEAIFLGDFGLNMCQVCKEKKSN